MRRSVISLVAGVALALLAVVLMTQYLKPKEQAAVAKDGMVRIVVAAADLPFGANLLRDYLKFTSWPADAVPVGAFTSMDALLVDAEGKGGARVVLDPLYTGEPVLAQKVSGFGEKATLSRKVADGKRASSIRVNDVSGVAGFLLPGDRVDIMLTRPATTGNSNLVTDVILQNIQILGIDQLTDQATDKPVLARTITVEVTPEEAQKLALAQQVGTLSLTLRGYANNDQAPTDRISSGDLAAGLSSGIMPASGPGIRVRRGMSLN